MRRLASIAIAVAAVAAVCSVSSAAAQGFPAKPVTLLIPFAPGGGTDILGRLLAERMKDALGQNVLPENVSGASGTIAIGRLVRAAPDGYTIIIGQWTSHVGAGALYTNLPYDIVNDQAPVARLTTAPLWIMGRTTLPAKNLQELVDWMKASPEAPSAATTGVGSGAHLCLLELARHSGTRLNLVPYRGAAPIMQEMMGNGIDLTCIETSQAISHYRSGKLRAFGIVNDKRWFVTPEVPTLEEGGVPGVHMPFWSGMWAPKNTPPEVIAKLNAAVVATFEHPATRKRLEEMGLEIPTREQLTPQALGSWHRKEVEKWWPIMRAANLQAEPAN